MAKAKAAAKPPAVAVVPIDKLAPDPANARRHTERNRSAVTASLKRFGPGRSIVLDRHDVIRAGNQTVESAREAGLTEVLVVQPEPHQLVAVKRPEWDEATATGYAIADNRAAEHAEWDDAVLVEQLKAVEVAGIELADVGFDGAELDALIADAAASINESAAPAAHNPTLAERFGVPPFSVLDARQGYWQDRKRAWLALGIQSELGRGDGGVISGSPLPLDR